METSRIVLRPWRESDAEVLYRWASDPDVGSRAGWPPHKSVEESLEIIRTIFHSDHMWAIELKETGETIGCIGYMVRGKSNIGIGENDAEVGYWVARPYWNRGICSEALRLLVDYCFKVKSFRTLWADYFPDNPAANLVEIVEIPEKRWYIGTQFHPEYSSSVLNPHPLFMSFIKASIGIDNAETLS